MSSFLRCSESFNLITESIKQCSRYRSLPLFQVAHHRSENSTQAKISIQVLDMDESVAFYTKALRMTLQRRRFDVLSDPPCARGVSYLVRVVLHHRITATLI